MGGDLSDAPRTLSGKMLWFDEAKDFGFIRTEEDERLYVHRTGFVDAAPVGRCATLPVVLTIAVIDGQRQATHVSMTEAEAPRRARRRSAGPRSR